LAEVLKGRKERAWDRHLLEPNSRILSFTFLIDCGSCLYPTPT
jgi:hypothetical protein